MLTPEHQREILKEESMDNHNKESLAPEFPASHWQAIINNFKAGIYSPGGKSSSGDLYVVLEENGDPTKLVLLVFQFKSGFNIVYNFGTVCSEAFKAIQLPAMNDTTATKDSNEQNKKKSNSVSKKKKTNMPEDEPISADALPIEKSVTHVIFIMVGGELTPEDSKAKCVPGEYAIRVHEKDMKNSKKKGTFSGQSWKRPDFFDIYILSAAGREHLVSPYNLETVGFSGNAASNINK